PCDSAHDLLLLRGCRGGRRPNQVGQKTTIAVEHRVVRCNAVVGAHDHPAAVRRTGRTVHGPLAARNQLAAIARLIVAGGEIVPPRDDLGRTVKSKLRPWAPAVLEPHPGTTGLVFDRARQGLSRLAGEVASGPEQADRRHGGSGGQRDPPAWG